jgi:flagellar motor switch/type III secretory pathway protein FliN
MNATVRPIRLVSAHAANAIELRVLTALLAWTQDWLPATSPELRVSVAGEVAGTELAGCFDAYQSDSGRLWVRREEADDVALAAAVLGMRSHGQSISLTDELLKHTLAQACRLRNEALAAVLIGQNPRLTTSAPDPGLAAYGSGALRIECAEIGLVALVDDGALQHVPPIERAGNAADAKLKPLEQTLSAARVALTATLSGVDLSLDALLGMREGDVLRLPLRLEDPLDVEVDGRRLVSAYLGTQDGHRAVQLVKPSI